MIEEGFSQSRHWKRKWWKIVKIVFLLKVVYIEKRWKANLPLDKSKKKTFIKSSCYDFSVCKKEIIFLKRRKKKPINKSQSKLNDIKKFFNLSRRIPIKQLSGYMTRSMFDIKLRHEEEIQDKFVDKEKFRNTKETFQLSESVCRRRNNWKVIIIVPSTCVNIRRVQMRFLCLWNVWAGI